MKNLRVLTAIALVVGLYTFDNAYAGEEEGKKTFHFPAFTAGMMISQADNYAEKLAKFGESLGEDEYATRVIIKVTVVVSNADKDQFAVGSAIGESKIGQYGVELKKEIKKQDVKVGKISNLTDEQLEKLL